MPVVKVEDCPDPSVHGSPFRYCPYCEWHEPVPEAVNAEDIARAIDPIPFMREELENPDSHQWRVRRNLAVEKGERVLRLFSVSRLSPNTRQEGDHA